MKRWILAAGGLAIALGLGTDGRADYPVLKARPKPLDAIPAYPYQSSGMPTRATATGTGQPRIGLGIPGDPATTAPDAPAGVQTTTVRDTTTCTITASRHKSSKVETRERTTTTGPGAAVETVPGEAATFTLREQVLRVDHCSVSGVSVVLYPDGRYAVRFRADQTLAQRTDTVQSPNPFKRNLFVLTVRGYANDPLGETGISATKAAVLQIPIEPFWVNRNESYPGFVEGRSDAVKRNYRWVDRVDMDFTYR